MADSKISRDKEFSDFLYYLPPKQKTTNFITQKYISFIILNTCIFGAFFRAELNNCAFLSLKLKLSH